MAPNKQATTSTADPKPLGVSGGSSLARAWIWSPVMESIAIAGYLPMARDVS